MSSIRPTAILLCTAIASQAITAAKAQSVRPAAIRVHVTDSAGAPVPGADVSIVRGLADVAVHGVTDAAGLQTLSMPRSGTDAELIVRKLGYVRVSRFFADTAAPRAFEITLARSPRTLDTVRVAEREDPVRKSYFIDADAIENSPRLVDDALDIVMKLRPDMIWSRAGRPDGIGRHVTAYGRFLPSITRNPRMAPGYGADCGDTINRPVANIWVNGERIRDVPVNPAAAARRVDNGVYIAPSIATVLASIKPEHVAEMQYHPCTESQQDVPPHTLNAIMVQLKEGIGFDPGSGSYVLQSRGAAVARAAPAGQAWRILGVFDDDTGEPIADADVIDAASGTRARTTTTGTVALVFLPPGASDVKIQRTGYATKILSVTISPADTMPITVVLTRSSAPPAT